MESPARNVSGEDRFSPLHYSFVKRHVEEVEVGKLLRVLGQSRGLSCTWRTEDNQKSSTGMNERTWPPFSSFTFPLPCCPSGTAGLFVQLMGIYLPPQMKSAEAVEQSGFEKITSCSQKAFKK